jgi:2-methylcitrate dehydratase PrpD
MAVGFHDGRAGFAQFTDDRIGDPRVLALASKIRYVINPDDEYPRNFSGHLRATLRDGRQVELRQPHLRGGAHAPLAPGELEAKFMDNARYGGWDVTRAERLLRVSGDIFTAARLDAIGAFRA